MREIVLVADDDAALRLLYTSWLRAEGWEVRAVANGRDAIAQVERAGLPHAAVLDVDMPHVDGLSVCSYLRTRGLVGSIVIVTAAEEASNAALQGGASDVLVKPCTRARLVAALRREPASVPSPGL